MNEAQWRQSRRPDEMLRFLGDRPGDRPLRLFAVACCRRVEALMKQPCLREALDLAQRFAGMPVALEREADEVLSSINQLDVTGHLYRTHSREEQRWVAAAFAAGATLNRSGAQAAF